MRAIVCAAIIAAACVRLGGRAPAADFEFDGASFSCGWEGGDASGMIKEYFTRKETPDTWKTIITTTFHPEARRLADVIVPYLEARKAIVSMPPKAHPLKDREDADVVVELFLGAPGKTPHVEYTLARFMETDTGVYSIVYGRKFLFSGQGDQNVDVDIAVRNGKRWIGELQAIPAESVRSCFLPGRKASSPGGPAAASPR